MSALETVAWRWKYPGHLHWEVARVSADANERDEAFSNLRCLGYVIEPLTPLAPAQAEIDKLTALLNASSDRLGEATDKLLAMHERALAAEEQVKVLSAEHASIVAMMQRWIKMIDDPARQKNGLSESLMLGIRRGASQAISALQQKEKPDGQ